MLLFLAEFPLSLEKIPSLTFSIYYLTCRSHIRYYGSNIMKHGKDKLSEMGSEFNLRLAENLLKPKLSAKWLDNVLCSKYITLQEIAIFI